MPHIFVKHSAFHGEELPKLFDGIIEKVFPELAALLSVEDWPLTADDFSIEFRQKDWQDVLLGHFQVIIFADAFPERVVVKDELSHSATSVFAKCINDFPWKFGTRRRETISLSVSLILGEIGYSTAVISLDNPD